MDINLTINIDSLTINLNTMALADVIAKLQEQDGKLDQIAANIGNIGQDVTNLKSLIQQLQDGAITPEQLEQLTQIADSIGSKVDQINTTSAELDNQTP